MKLDREVDRLYELPLKEFTPARDALAKKLRKGGDKEAADEVKGLKKPSETAWAVNQLARNNRRELNALLKAGDRLRKAQGGGGKRDELRAAVADERERVGKLAALAEELLGKATGAKLDRVRNTLHAAAGDEETRELIDAGRLVEDAEPVGFGLLGPVEATGDTKRSEKKAPAKKAAPRDDGAARKARRELETARKREKDAREKADRARTELKRARAAAEDAAKALQNAERRAKEAEARESDAQEKLAQTEQATGK